MADKIYLGENASYEIGKGRDGYNDNVLVVGGTGCGKTVSVNIPTALHLKETSTVMTFSKRKNAEMMIKSFKEKGYDVLDLNLAEPQKTGVVYDPMDFVKTDEEAIGLAEAIVNSGVTNDNITADEKYWVQSGINVITAFIEYLKLTDVEDIKAEARRQKSSFKYVIELSNRLKITDVNNSIYTSELDILFEELEKSFGNCIAVQNYMTIKGLAIRAASCIISIVKEALSSFVTPSVVKMFTSDKPHLDFKLLGDRKTALIITTNPINTALSKYIAVMYYQLFNTLFEKAEANNGTLNIPVQIMVDDFGNNKIEHFEELISVFREAGIAVTLFMQSDKQLKDIYGENEGSIIKDNCGTYCYFSGSQNLDTAKELSDRLDIPIKKILTMPKGKVCIFRSGNEALITERYQTFEDELYRRCLNNTEKVLVNELT